LTSAAQHRSVLTAFIVGALLLTSGLAHADNAATLDPVSAREREALFRHIDAAAPQSAALLEEIVNQNSGTFNVAGFRVVAERLEREFRALGSKTRWV
jgi:hypothetical protein